MKDFVPFHDVAMFQGCSVFVFSHCAALRFEIRFRFYCKAHCSETLIKPHFERKNLVNKRGGGSSISSKVFPLSPHLSS